MIELDFSGHQPIYEQIIQQVKMALSKGELKPGDAIPSVRKMALELSVTPATVAKAYQELERQKIIETIRAKGTFIAANVKMKVDDDKLTIIQKKITGEILELKMMGYSVEEVKQFVADIYTAL